MVFNTNLILNPLIILQISLINMFLEIPRYLVDNKYIILLVI